MNLRGDRLKLGIILLLVVLLYLNSFWNNFTNWDDNNLIVKNRRIRSLALDNLKRIFVPHVGSTYQPIREFSYAIDYAIWRLNPIGYHLTNLILYLLTIVVIYFLLKRFLKEDIAFLATAIFAVHPLHVEAVTYLAARKEVLANFFFFLSFYLYITADRKKKEKFLVLSFISFVLALLSKPSAVTLPVCLLMWDTYFSKKKKSRFINEVPFWGMMLVILGYFIFFSKTIVPKEGSFYPGIHPLIITRQIANYIAMLVAPVKMCIRYPDYFIKTMSLFDKLLGVAVFLLLVALIIAFYRKRKKVSFFIAWFLVNLLPTSGLLRIAIQRADRYVFISSLSYAALLSMGIFYTAKRIRKKRYGKIAILIALPFLIFYSSLTVQRNFVWRNTKSIWEDAYKKYPKNYIICWGVGRARNEYHEYKEAIPPLLWAYKINPREPKVLYNIGQAYSRTKQYDKAVRYFEEALAITGPEKLHPSAMRDMGSSFLMIGKFDKGEYWLEKALEHNPRDLLALSDLGVLYFRTGRPELSEKMLTRALEINPRHPLALRNLGTLYYKSGDKQKALEYLKRYLNLYPRASDAEKIRKAVQKLEAGETEKP